jgi:FtsH-binding integral membrane protein
MTEHAMKPIWYFVGLILMIMGGLIMVTGLYHVIDPPAVKKILSDTHPDIWWGAIMAAFGAVMFAKTRKQSV